MREYLVLAVIATVLVLFAGNWFMDAIAQSLADMIVSVFDSVRPPEAPLLKD